MGFFERLKQQKLLSFSLVIFTLAVGIMIGTTMNTGVWAARAQNGAPDATPLVIPAASPKVSELAALVKRIEPAVVNISTDYTAKPPAAARNNKKNAPPSDDEEDNNDGMELFRRFFKNMPDAPQKPYKSGGTGSGFVVDKNGYIITNNHVIEKADHIKVKFPHDQTEYRAKLIGTDVETDVAVIKIDPAGKQLQTLKIGNSESMLVGDGVIAIGSPFGLEASVTSGIVSATGRDLAGAQAFQRFIQTDAAINPGNSGGPLLNNNGEVIGVNTLIATQSGGYQGIGFALPINTAVNVYNSIIREGRVARGSIGIRFKKYEQAAVLLKALGLKEGVLVEEVMPGFPAEKAGLKEDDVIVGFNGKPVKDGDDLVTRVSQAPIGSTANLTIDRGGQHLEKKVVIGDREQQRIAANDDPRAPRNEKSEEPGVSEEKQQAKFGISIRNLTDAERENPTLSDKKGVVVTQVVDGSFAEDVGLQDRDVIVSINRHPVNSVEDVRKIQGMLKAGDAVAFRVMRPGAVPGRGGRIGTQYQGFWVSGTLPSAQ